MLVPLISKIRGGIVNLVFKINGQKNVVNVCPFNKMGYDKKAITKNEILLYFYSLNDTIIEI